MAKAIGPYSGDGSAETGGIRGCLVARANEALEKLRELVREHLKATETAQPLARLGKGKAGSASRMRCAPASRRSPIAATDPDNEPTPSSALPHRQASLAVASVATHGPVCVLFVIARCK